MKSNLLFAENSQQKNTKLTTKVIYMCTFFPFFLFFFFLSQVTLNKLHGWLEWTKKFLGVYHVLVSLGFYGVYVYSSILDEGPLVKPYPL